MIMKLKILGLVEVDNGFVEGVLVLFDFAQKVVDGNFGFVDILLPELWADITAVDIFLYFA